MELVPYITCIERRKENREEKQHRKEKRREEKGRKETKRKDQKQETREKNKNKNKNKSLSPINLFVFSALTPPIAHLDLKSPNIVLCNQKVKFNSGPLVKLIDFGNEKKKTTKKSQSFHLFLRTFSFFLKNKERETKAKFSRFFSRLFSSNIART